jgi:peptidoglycan/LPS O-acetylase OafA/YrhL
MKIFTPLTGLRGLAALWVVVSHLFGTQGWLIAAGGLGVDVFFVLSGFIISHVHLREFSRTVEPRPFFVFLGLRLARVYPLHLLMTCLLIPVTLLPGFTEAFHPNAFTAFNLFANFLLIQNWLFFFMPAFWLGPGWSWNGPAWSLSVEWFVYLAFPFLAVAFARVRSTVLLLAAALLPMVALTVIFSIQAGAVASGGMGRAGMVKGIAEFISGIAIYRLWYDTERFKAFAERYCTLAAVIFIAVASSPEYHALSIFALVVLIPGLAEGRGYFARVCESAPIRYLGDISFSLYLSHLPLILLANHTARQLGFQEQWSNDILLHLILMIPIMLVAHLLFFRFERPARLAGRAVVARINPALRPS